MAERRKKRRGDRYDARRIKLGYDLNAVFPYMMKGRNESAVYYTVTADVENLLTYIEEHKRTATEITFFQAIILALIKTLRNRPALNRYVIGRRLYERDNVELSFIAKREFSDEGSETNVYLKVKPEMNRDEVLDKIKGGIDSAKSGQKKNDDAVISLFMHLPRALLRLAIKLLEWWDFYFDTPKFLRNGADPLRCSAYIANLGSVGIDAPFHHLFEWGTCSLFLTIGKIREAGYPSEGIIADSDNTSALADKPSEKRRVVDFRVTLDERIGDGYYYARSLDLFAKYISNPTELEEIGVCDD